MAALERGFSACFSTTHSLLRCDDLLCSELEARVPQAALPRLRDLLWYCHLSRNEPGRTASQRTARRWPV